MDFEKIAAAVGELDEESMISCLKAVMEAGGSNAQAAMEACRKGLDTVGRLYEEGEYFVGDLIFAGELMTEAVEILKDGLASGAGAEGEKTKMIICTVKGDMHDIGKNIVKAMLEANGFEVTDLGTDTPVELITETTKKENIKIVALSGVLTLALDSMKKTVEALRCECPECRVIIGGAPVTEDACRITGADEWAQSPQKTVDVCKSWR